MDIAELGLMVRSDGLVVADARLKKLAGSAKVAETATQRLIRKTEKMNAVMKKVGKNLSMFVTLPLLAMGVGAIKAFANFDEAMVSSMAIMGDLSDAMKTDMADTAKEVALTTAFSAKQAADSYFFLASAGLDAAASIAALPKVAKFAQAGNFDMAKATDILTDAQSALGKVMKDPIKNMEEMVALSDVLVKANTIANASVQQFGEALTNKAGTAMKLLNIDVETGVAVLAAWADQGIKGVEAGEKMNIVTRDLQTAYRKNTQEFQNQNVAVFDSLGNFRNMADIVGELEVAMSTLTPEQQGNTLALMGFQDRSVMAIKSLLGLSEKIRGYEGDLRQAGDITEDVANKQMQTFNKQMGLMKDKLVGIGIELGEKLVPLMDGLKDSLDDFLTWISEAVDTFTNYDVETQKMILGAVAFATVLGPLLIVLGMLAQSIIFLLPLLSGLVGVFSVSMPFAAIALGIGLIVDALGDLYIAKLEEAIGVTGDFAIALDTLDAVILESNLATVNEQLTIYVTEQEKAADRLRTVNNMIDDAQSGRTQSGGLDNLLTEQAELNTLMSELNLNVEQQTRLRDSYNERLGISSMLAWDEGEAYGELVPAVEAVTAAIGLTADELEELTTWWNTLRAEMDPVAEAQRQYELGLQMLKLASDEFNLSVEEQDAAIAQLTETMNEANGSTELLDWWKELEAAIDPVAAATEVYKEEVAKLDAVIASNPKIFIDRAKAIAFLKKEMHDSSGATAKYTKEQEKFFKAMEKYKKVKALVDPAGAAIDELSEKLKDFDEVRKTLAKGGVIFTDEHWAEMEAGIERAVLGTETLGESLERAGSLAGDALRLIQSSMNENTKEYAAMNVMIQAANVSKAIGAVLSQAQGDPYTAFGRMATMAAAVAALGVSIGSFSNSGQTDPTEERQKTQGAGGVLGDAEAKSESIMNAIEITADATSELVGINRGMLSALNALKMGLVGASTQLVRGGVDGSNIPVPDAETAGWVDLLTGGGIFDLLGLNFIGDFISKLLGGKTKLLDTGLQIEGGAITDLINDVMVRAFADIKKKKWFGGKYKFDTIFKDIEDGVGKQLALVFGSIVDTVTQAAIALGIPLDVIEARIAEFEVETLKISMEDMTGKEQQDALLAVFSKVFDDLAIDIVPFIDQFQQVGEGLGETLVRVATSVQITQEAVKMLGLSLDETDPEKFAQIAVGLVEMAGGVSEFITKLQNFISKFATQEWQDNIAIDAVTRGFEQLGITLPDTREGLWDFVQGLDLTTESGREAYTAIMDMTDSLDTYYDVRTKIFDAEIAALLHIQSIAEGVSNSLQALRDRIIGETSTDEENYNRYKAEADQLTVDLATMTDPDLIAETVAEIERLTSLAWGLLDESQKEKMGADFLTFLEGVEAIALERLNLAADDAVANTAFTPEEILARFNDLVTDPLILVAGVQGIAALKLDSAADKLLSVTGADYSINVDPAGDADATTGDFTFNPEVLARIRELIEASGDTIRALETIPPPVVDPGPTAEEISAAVEAGMQAGSEALLQAAATIIATGDSSNAATISAARTIAGAVSSIPSRIVVETRESEFS
jgi:TP901 family phage tail tape measure protein